VGIVVFAGLASFRMVMACGAFTSSDDAPAADAAFDSPDGSATPEATTPEATAPDGAAFVCPNTALFCDDFERDTDAQGNWSKMVVDDGGALSLVPDDRAPGGHSLEVLLPITSADGTRVFLDKEFASSQSARVTFAFRVAQPATSGVIVAQLDMGDAGYVYAQLHQGDFTITGKLPLDDGGLASEDAAVLPSTFGTIWHQITFEYLVGPPRILRLTVDGVHTEITPLVALGPINSIRLGSLWKNAGEASSFVIDDVQIDTGF
jgi:hypothetical protein